MHTLAVQLAPILAAEKSKVPFYVAGGLLVAWALILSLGLGMRREKFPGTLGGERIVIAISVVLVLAATATAVITSSSPPKESQAEASTEGAATPGPPPVRTAPSGSSTSAGAPPAGSPKATTGTPIPPSSPAAVTRLKLAANPSGLLSYDTKQLTAKAGKVTIDFTNASPVEHDVAVEQARSVVGSTPVFTGGSKTLTLNLKPGTYKFFCSVPGHRQAGMEGTLTVS